jgi:16S rRNA (cytosine1402-N4)-methyltransferase
MTHIPVLKDESVDGLNIHSGDVIVDGTLGGGGHTFEIIKRYGKNVRVIGLDFDSDAISRAEKLIGNTPSNFKFFTIGFQAMDEVLDELGIKEINGILLDLGISSFQLEVAGRGFSFLKDEPLLMTMKKDPSDEDLSAREIVNTWEEESIADIIYGFGEEKYSRKIAHAIIVARKEKNIETTFDLVKIIDESIGKYYRKMKIHPATRTFQALRIATNRELINLEEVIENGFKRLAVGGRMSIITFHSLEDRIVKRAFVSLKEKGKAKIITKKPMVPKEEELKINPRSRSAKLRLIEKL